MQTPVYHLILGCNLGNRLNQITEGLHLLEEAGGNITMKSQIYETEPWGYPDQPWFLNQVISYSTDADPRAMLATCKKIEIDLGRQSSEKWHARHMDIDILLCGELIYHDDLINIPHPQMQDRNFVLVPLMEIASGMIHPVFHKSIEELYLDCMDIGEVYIFSADEHSDPL